MSCSWQRVGNLCVVLFVDVKMGLISFTLLSLAIGPAIRIFKEKGFICGLYWIASYVYLKITNRFNGRRLDLYNFTAEGHPEKLGFFNPEKEWILESPQEDKHLEKNSDDMIFAGVNSKSESISLFISRQAGGNVFSLLDLRLEDGRRYTLPPQHSFLIETDESHTFGTSRFKVQCLLPMRKWRIFFNGTLQETSENQKETTPSYRHVRFTFIWTASSDVYDYAHDMSPKVEADAAVRFLSWKSPSHFIRRLRDAFNGYDQSGMFLGTVIIEDEPEREVYLWGNRGRFLGEHADLPSSGSEATECKILFINAENGTYIRLGLITMPGLVSDFPYGYIMRPNGFVHPVDSCTLSLKDNPQDGEINFDCVSDNETYKVKLTPKASGSISHGVLIINQAEGKINSMPARGIIFDMPSPAPSNDPEATPQEPDHEATIPKRLNSVEQAGLIPKYIPLCVPFHDPCCQVLSVSGGKGSSLAKLTVMSKEDKTFTVPNGIVVTTSAYKHFTQGFLEGHLKKLEKVAWKQDSALPDVNSACENVMKSMVEAELSKTIQQSVERSLHEVFGKDLTHIRLAVRSSATGEDTEQMSAAGQMETFLGCRGISEVLNAVKKCWASQFSFVAVQYKRRYGQLLDTPMAVVIQEMVPCDVAGVAFTCDPVTGNPAFVSITANYGLGESVVSASAEPDTVTLQRDINNELQFYSKSAGIKQSKIVMDESGGTKEVKLDESNSSAFSIDEDTAMALGNITVKIETNFGAPRDIEWGVHNGKIFLFQARPVTTIDTDTEFETMHMFDTHLRREDEPASTANVGEVLPGSTSPLGMEASASIMVISIAKHRYVKWDGESMPTTPYYPKSIVYAFNHVLFCLSDGFFKFSQNEDEEVSNHTKAITVAIFGRVIDDKRIFQISKDRHASEKQKGTPIISIIYMGLYMFFARYFTSIVSKTIDKFHIPIEKNSSSSEILSSIGKHYHGAHPAMSNHMDCTFTSPFWNLSLLTLLSKANGVWDNDVYRDFGYLLSSCERVESADVPAAIQSLGCTISRCIDPDTFKKMSVDEALEWLQTTSSNAGAEFRNFLIRHGHRCFKEFDVYSKTWAMDPRTLVKTLKGVVTKDMVKTKEKKRDSFQDIVDGMLVKLSFLQRLQLRLLLPHCLRGVREREVSKSLVIRAMDRVRTAFYQLAHTLVSEGRLPNWELMFFLVPEEINQLIKTRSPTLVTRAFKRWKCHPVMDKMIFPEMINGIPKPINMNEDVEDIADGFTMTGVPVSQGVIKGVARVVVNIEDAPNIQYGDILITYSTDIAWSPYFPMLSGVVTELGGLISHGAVVARECGLPCVVNLHGATRAFKSGDYVLLDGNRGILKKL